MQFHGVVAHPWILERRNVLARRMYNRLVTGARNSGKEILAEEQWRLNALISGCGNSAYQLVSGSDPADLLRWDEMYEDLLFARYTSLSGQLVQLWKLRTMAQKAAVKEVANGKL